jgi:GT2 family glycosyltransferase
MNKTHVLVVNINNLNYTRDCIQCLIKQDVPFDLTVVDQNSSEAGTHTYYESLKKTWPRKDCNLKIIKNNDNVDLNRVWNNFYEITENEYICFLNNDVVIPPNFISDGEKIFTKESRVGCVVHATNHKSYQAVTPLKYAKVKGIKQGWDYTMRRSAYNVIPNELKVYCGDDFLFEMLFRNGWECAFALSSPIIHFQGKSSKYLKEPSSDVKRYAALGFNHNLRSCPAYTNIKPTFNNLILKA